jgi:hypothetical protein
MSLMACCQILTRITGSSSPNRWKVCKDATTSSVLVRSLEGGERDLVGGSFSETFFSSGARSSDGGRAFGVGLQPTNLGNRLVCYPL